MGFLSSLGRALFAFYFLYSAYREFSAFGVDGGPMMRSFRSSFNRHLEYLNSNFGLQLPDFEIKYVIATGIALKGFGGFLFVLGSSFGAYLLLLHLAIAAPFSHTLYSYGKPGFIQTLVKFTQDLALVGALMFFIGMKSSIMIRKLRKRHLKSKMG